jgi:uncharacterized protein
VTDTTETNRRFLRALFSTIASEGWADGFMAALHDDLVFNAMGTSPVAGRYQGKQVYRTQVLDRLHTRLASWPMPIVDTMIVDGNMASVQFHSEGGKGHNGADFNIQYCWVIRLDRERIAEIWGYYDSGKMVALFDDA